MTVSTFLMFEGNAEEAMRLYVTLFPRSEIKQVAYYGPGEPGAEGSVKHATFTVGGHDLMCIDSPAKHAFTFTPSLSLYVDCDSEAEFDAAFDKLLGEGGVLMPPDNYGFSTKFVWFRDRWGVSWQLNLP